MAENSKVIHSGWHLGQLTEVGHGTRCAHHAASWYGLYQGLPAWYIILLTTQPLGLLTYSHTGGRSEGVPRSYPRCLWCELLGPWRTVVVLGMGGGGWNRPSLGLSCRTETPPQPHPIAASQEAREGLEVPFPVCVSTASQRLHFSCVSQRLTEMRLFTFLLGMCKGFEEPHPPLRTEQLWGLFLTPSFCVVFWFI